MNQRTLMEEPIIPSNETRPIELYVFIDPLCTDCWALQPTLRKLQVEYDRYFTLRFALRTSISKMNRQCLQERNASQCSHRHPAYPSIAIKAAEFQGKRAAFRFLSKVYEYRFVKQRDVASFTTLVEIAETLQLDVREFISDFSSHHVFRSLQIDLYLANEMEVAAAPTFVFFNENIEDEGLMVSGFYPYEVYEQILKELLGSNLLPEQPPSINELLQRFDSLATKEIADLYQITEKEAEREMKKRLLQQEVECLTFQNITIWKKSNRCNKVSKLSAQRDQT